jgi:hypothetical protein
MYAVHPQNTTSIDDLPELEELENPTSIKQPNGNFPEETNKYTKFIRGGHAPPPESGMIPLIPRPGIGMEDVQHSEHDIKLINMPENTPSCLDVCAHIMNCPICSKFYNNDKTAYMIAIAVLAIVCILLLKKVLDV